MNDEDKQAGNSSLPRDIQEHLGRRLRTELHLEAEKPAFLGESSLPPQFETLVRKLEAGQSSEKQGYDAVKRALIGETEDGVPPSPPSSSPKLPKIPKRTD